MSEIGYAKTNSAYTAVFRVVDSSSVAVTGLVNSDFTKLLYKDAATSAVTVTITEIDNGQYKAVYTPTSDGLWSLIITNATYNTAGWQDDIRTYAFDFSDLAHRVTNSSVNDGSASTTVFITSLSSSTTDFWKGSLVIFTSGTLLGQYRHVKGYNGSTKAITVDALTSAPANSVTFDLVAAPDPDLIAKQALIKPLSEVEASATTYRSLSGVVATETGKRDISGSTLSIKKTDDSTELYNATLVTNSAQSPITGIHPN